MSKARKKNDAEVVAGGGGLGGRDGKPMQVPGPSRGYQPEASVTGQIKGPAVPSNLPAKEIIDRIERPPVSAPGDPKREQMHPAQKHRAPPKPPEHLEARNERVIEPSPLDILGAIDPSSSR